MVFQKIVFFLYSGFLIIIKGPLRNPIVDNIDTAL